MSISMSKDYGSHFIRKGEDKAKIRKGVWIQICGSPSQMFVTPKLLAQRLDSHEFNSSTIYLEQSQQLIR
jgi:hypothetical protein